MKEAKSSKCLFCDEKHDSSNCEKARNLSREERTKIVQDKRGCFKCLKVGHSYKKCHNKEKCPWCGKGHSILMCRHLSYNNEQTSAVKKETNEQNFHEGSSSLTNISLNVKVFLPTLRVKLHGPKGTLNVRAVINTSSHQSYVLGKIAEDLEYETVGEQTMIHLLFGGGKSKPQKHKAYRICVCNLEETYRCYFRRESHLPRYSINKQKTMEDNTRRE